MPSFSQDTKDRIRKKNPKSLLSVEIIKREGNWNDIDDLRALINRVVTSVADYPKILLKAQREVCVVLSSDRDIQNLNFTYRGKNCPTNVLSFPSPKNGLVEVQSFMGDIILAKETIEREAVDNKISFSDHLSHLTVHGLLHLMGYSHETEREANIMEGLEIEILSRLGISNPYKKTP